MANVQRSRLRAVRILVLSACMFLSAPARAGDLTEQVRNTVDRVLTIVKSSQPISKVQVEARRVQLADAINPTFDFTDMAKRSLGRHWAGRRPEEQREFVTIFGPLSGPLRVRPEYSLNFRPISTSTSLSERQKQIQITHNSGLTPRLLLGLRAELDI